MAPKSHKLGKLGDKVPWRPSEPWKFVRCFEVSCIEQCWIFNNLFYFQSERMPTNKELADDDPELLDLMEGGGLQAGTIREGGIFRSEMLRKKGGHRK